MPPDVWPFYLIGAIVCAAIAAAIARAKGHSPFKWFFAGLFFGIVGVLVIALRRARQPRHMPPPSEVRSGALPSGQAQPQQPSYVRLEKSYAHDSGGMGCLTVPFSIGTVAFGGLILYWVVTEGVQHPVLLIPGGVWVILGILMFYSGIRRSGVSSFRCPNCGERYGRPPDEWRCKRCSVSFYKED